MYQIRTFNKISPLGLDEFDPALFHVSDAVEQPDGILVRSAKLHDYDFPKNLRAIARAGAGVNNIPSTAAPSRYRGLQQPGRQRQRRQGACRLLPDSGFPQHCGRFAVGARAVRRGRGCRRRGGKGKSAFLGPEVAGKTLGVIGLGAVGGKLASTAIKLGMTVYGYDPYLSVEYALDLSVSSTASRIWIPFIKTAITSLCICPSWIPPVGYWARRLSPP
jgi:D-3-phosphoglycerate dehydrogenase